MSTSNESKLVAAIDRLGKELARNTAALDRSTAAGQAAMRDADKSLKSLDELLKRLWLFRPSAEVPVRAHVRATKTAKRERRAA